jgi:hypothetical protein
MDKGSAVVDSTNGLTQSLGGSWISVVLALWERMRGSTWSLRTLNSSGNGMDPSIRRQSFILVLPPGLCLRTYVMGNIVFRVVISDCNVSFEMQSVADSYLLCWAVKTLNIDIKPPVSLL